MVMALIGVLAEDWKGLDESAWYLEKKVNRAWHAIDYVDEGRSRNENDFHIFGIQMRYHFLPLQVSVSFCDVGYYM